MDEVEETAQRIIDAAVALYVNGPDAAAPDIYAYFASLVEGLPAPHTPVLPP